MDETGPFTNSLTAGVLRRANGIAFYNDEAIIGALRGDGLSLEDARDYCIVGCIETSGQSDTHGCPGGHELVLPAVLLLTLSRGRRPPPAPGQRAGFDSGDLRSCAGFADLLQAFRRQLIHQIQLLVQAVAGKDRSYQEILPTQALRQRQINLALETSGHWPAALLDPVVQAFDWILFDLKHVNPEKCRRVLGSDLRGARQNLRQLLDVARGLELRLTLIPGFNDSRADLQEIGRTLRALSSSLTLRLLPYHRLARAKQRLLPSAPTADDDDRQLHSPAALSRTRHWLQEEGIAVA